MRTCACSWELTDRFHFSTHVRCTHDASTCVRVDLVAFVDKSTQKIKLLEFNGTIACILITRITVITLITNNTNNPNNFVDPQSSITWQVVEVDSQNVPHFDYQATFSSSWSREVVVRKRKESEREERDFV